MPDDNCNDRAQKAMKQVETPLNTSGMAGVKVRSPHSTQSSATKNRESLNIHCDPYRK